MSTVGVREFAKRDLDPAERLLASAIKSGVANFHWEAPARGALEETWLAQRARYAWLSLELDGRWAGFANSGPYKPREAYKWTTEVGIYLEKWARGAGHGRVLYGSLLDALSLRGFRLAIAGITLPGEASCALHRSLGFGQVGVLRQVGWKLGAWHDVSIWQRNLGRSPDAPG